MQVAQTLPEASPACHEEVVQRIGHMLRMLRESMRELGLDKEVEKAAQAIPDARDRLSYIGNMTEQAAERSLNAIDRAQPIQSETSRSAQALRQRWEAWFAEPIELSQARELVDDTRGFLGAVPERMDGINRELMEITMAQDFQDLTGQVIKKMMDMIHALEFQLLQVVLDSVPEEAAREELQRRANQLREAETRRSQEFLNGPQVNEAAPDIVNGQDQVDDLLADLGF